MMMILTILKKEICIKTKLKTQNLLKGEIFDHWRAEWEQEHFKHREAEEVSLKKYIFIYKN